MASKRPRLGANLGNRELAVLFAIVEHGGNSRELGRILGLGELTVKTHKANIARKLGTSGLGSSTSASVAVAFRSGLLNEIPSLAKPDPEYVAWRIHNPYTVRYEDGDVEFNPWSRKLPEEMDTE